MTQYDELVNHVINELDMDNVAKPLWISISCAVLILEEFADKITTLAPRQQVILRQSLSRVMQMYWSCFDSGFKRRISALTDLLMGSTELHGNIARVKQDDETMSDQRKVTDGNRASQLKRKRRGRKRRRQRCPSQKCVEEFAATERRSSNCKAVEEIDQRLKGVCNTEDHGKEKAAGEYQADQVELKNQRTKNARGSLSLNAAKLPRTTKRLEVPQSESALSNSIRGLQPNGQSISERCDRDQTESSGGIFIANIQWEKWVSKNSGISEILHIEKLLQMTIKEFKERNLQTTVYEMPVEVIAVRFADSKSLMIKQSLIISAHLCKGILTGSRDNLRFIECATNVVISYRTISAVSCWRQLTITSSTVQELQRAVKFIRYILAYRLTVSYEETVRIFYLTWYRAPLKPLGKDVSDYRKANQRKKFASVGPYTEDVCNLEGTSATVPFMIHLDSKELQSIIGPDLLKNGIGSLFQKKRQLSKYNRRSTLCANGHQSGAVMGVCGCTAAVIEHITDTIISLEQTDNGLETEIIVHAKQQYQLERAIALISLLMEGTIQLRNFSEGLFNMFAELKVPSASPMTKNKEGQRQRESKTKMEVRTKNKANPTEATVGRVAQAS
ncbi:hypothetical protein M514_06903 [Trichuris suis]|uniref:Uncharacterized protein n=1 Tax=Trichuris suis TaxID=68888 RepID=A0A085NLM3_9BILA|nr:hypothetical protein M514_06903 [Trichuris suis]